MNPIKINQKFELFSEYWTPKIIAQMNNYQIKVAKIKGEFVWHKHLETDETFIIIQGEMKILFREGDPIKLKAGEMFVVPKGKEHKPVAKDECHILMIELSGTINTGDAGGEKTITESAWI